MVQGDFITSPIADPDPVDQAWKYLETATLDGPTPALLNLNGLRLGRLDARFQEEFNAVLKKTDIVRRFPQAVQMIPGRPQEFNIGPVLTDRTVFVWTSLDSLVGRRCPSMRYGFAILVQPDGDQRAQVSLTPVLRYGTSLTRRLDLSALSVSASMRSGQSLVLMPTRGTPTGLGTAFFWGAERNNSLRTFVVITLSSIHETEQP